MGDKQGAYYGQKGRALIRENKVGGLLGGSTVFPLLLA